MFGKNQKSVNPHQSVGAIFLILLGGAYLLATSGFISWAAIGLMFAFLPAAWMAYCGWRVYQETGQLSGRVIVHLLWGLFPFIFLGLWYVGLNPGSLWPLILVFAGLTMLVNAREVS